MINPNTHVPFFPSELPVGTVISFAGNIQENTSPPPKNATDIESIGWMVCDGRSLKRGEYPTLFSVIGDLYGSSDNQSFNIPDYRGLFLRGNWVNDKQESSIKNLKEAATENRESYKNSTSSGLGSLQTDAVQTHEHVYNAVPTTTTPSEGGPNGAGPSPPTNNPALTNKGPTTDKNNPPGKVKVSQYETRSYNTFINYIIKFDYFINYSHLPEIKK